MYIVLNSNHEWWMTFDEETAQYFARYDPKFNNDRPHIFKFVAPLTWEEIKVKGIDTTEG